ncbi:hypothetical protein LguiA_022506 [Lonicera macranthoides]
MPAKKRSSSENLHNDGDEESPRRHKQSRRERKEEREEEERVEDEDEEEESDDDDDEEEEEEEQDSSDGSVGDPEDLPEFLDVKLTDVRKDVQCPICLGIIKKTRTVMECMHRFCRECIDKSMRLGNNECPACRTHCASRRSLRDDPRFDALIECLYPDIEKYEEEELAFHEEERNRNKQIQESIAQIFQRQSEALIKRRRKGKDQPAASKARSTRNYQSPYSRRKRNSGSTEIQGSDENEDEENGNKDSCSTDEPEPEPETKRRRYTRRTRSTNLDSGCGENETDASKESRGSMEGLAWGRGGARSHARHGSGSGSKGTRSTTRLSKLADYLQSLQEKGDKYVAHETSALRAEEDGEKMLPVKEEIPNNNLEEDSTITTTCIPKNANPLYEVVVGQCEAAGPQNFEAQESLAGLKANLTSSREPF